MTDSVTVTRDDHEIEIADSIAVQDLFEYDAEVSIGDQIEEWTVTAIDAEFDYVKSVGNVFRIYCYFEPIARSAIIGEDDLTVPNWERQRNMLSDDGTFCIIYELEP